MRAVPCRCLPTPYAVLPNPGLRFILRAENSATRGPSATTSPRNRRCCSTGPDTPAEPRRAHPRTDSSRSRPAHVAGRRKPFRNITTGCGSACHGGAAQHIIIPTTGVNATQCALQKARLASVCIQCMPDTVVETTFSAASVNSIITYIFSMIKSCSIRPADNGHARPLRK